MGQNPDINVPPADDDSPVGPGRSAEDPAAAAERAHTPRTPFLALAGVWVVVAVVVGIVVALALTLYFVFG
jgi:hypothetical protein